ncbi:MAG: hypothetical protein JXA69_02135 [Phycisphaerae bacterium]|nr:hypothetical protein [Phycisphaerae bacterium]
MGLILLTFGVLQAYQLSVTSVLLLLHSRRRAAEDQPSLLLVATLFWTGPLAAAAEMVTVNARQGAFLVVGGCLVALGELRVVRRALGLKFSIWGRIAVCAWIVLLSGLPLLLKLRAEVTGMDDEVLLYLGWWMLAGIVLLSLGTVRGRGRPGSAVLAQKHKDLRLELVLLALVLGETIAHLVAMNYAFFTHARWFYASPLLVAVAVVGLEWLARAGRESRWLVAGCAGLPAVAIALALQPFDEKVPTVYLPAALRDPMIGVLLVATAAWWFGYWRHAWPALLHAGNASLALAVFRLVKSSTVPGAISISAPVAMPSCEMIVVVLYGIAGYFAVSALWRQSRSELFACLLAHQAAVTVWFGGQSDAGHLIIVLVAGWQWVLWHQLAAVRPGLVVACLPIVFLVATTWSYDFNDSLVWLARAHALVMVAVFVLIGLTWSQQRYSTMGSLVGACHVAFYASRWAATGTNPAANVIVVVGFVLLVSGTAISWYKPALLNLTRRALRSEPDEASG